MPPSITKEKINAVLNQEITMAQGTNEEIID